MKYDGVVVKSGGQFGSFETQTFGSACGVSNPTPPPTPAPPTEPPTPQPTPVPTTAAPTSVPTTAAPTSAPTGCQGVKVVVDILTDNYPGETSWTVTDKCGSAGVIIMFGESYSNANTLYSESVCTAAGEYEFTINVSKLLFVELIGLFHHFCYC